MGQEAAARDADEEQRRAHADPHGEERERAAQHVPGLADHGERRDQRRCDAGGHDQRRERPHDGGADEAAGFLPARNAREPRFAGRRGS